MVFPCVKTGFDLLKMLTVSLHDIHIHAPYGLYPEERIVGNDFEIDVDLTIPTTDGQPLPFADYTLINTIVTETFKEPAHLLETLAQNIHAALKMEFPEAEKIKVTVKKLRPPMPGEVKYAQVCYEG